MWKIVTNKLRIVKLICLVAFIGFLAGCTGAATKQTDPFLEKWKKTAASSKGHTPAPDPQTRDVFQGNKVFRADKASHIDEKTLPTKRLTLRRQNVELVTLLRDLARTAGLNILINQNVKGKTSIHIVDKPWDQIFEGLLRNHGMAYEWEGDILRIISLQDIQLERDVAEANQRVLAQSRKQEMVEPVLISVVQINYPNPENLKGSLEKLLSRNKSGHKRGSVVVDDHTNSLIIQAIKADMERIIAVIDALDKPTPQVLIEVVIVEATQETAMELGVQWGGLSRGMASGKNMWVTGSNSGTFNGLTPGPAGGYRLSDGIVDPTAGYALNWPAGTLSGLDPFSMGLIYERAGEAILSLQLSALQDEGKLNILSNPSITTMNNAEANIESGLVIAYATVSADGTQVQWRDVLLSLKVRPTVINANTVKLRIKTRNDDLSELIVNGFSAIDTKEADTTVVLYSGETTMIGGLSTKRINDTDTGIPGVKNIPLLGYLFKTKGESSEMEDILIFITPHILEKKQ